MERRTLAQGLAALLVASTLATADPAPGPSGAGPACGFRIGDWCPAPAGDPCGAHPDEKSCRADARCRGLRYRGESVVACMPDGQGFSSNCPAVGCVSRSEAPGTAPRAEVVKQLCSPPSGGEGAEIRVWRSQRDEATVLELRQGPRHPHPAVVYHDVLGDAQLTIPAAVAPGSDLGRSFGEMRAALLDKLHAAETIRCVP
jgi:hypothetical protein